MRCWNCGKKIPDKAEVCGFCEAAVKDEPTEDEKAAIADVLSQMPPEDLDELRAALDGSETAEDFADRIFVGDCPGEKRCQEPFCDSLLIGNGS
jgi:hypothetical protein